MEAYSSGRLTTPPELKRVEITPDKLGTVQVILDGQQRLTTLYMLINGEIPPFYREADISTDPRGLYFDLETGEFQYFQATKMRGNPTWHSVVDCFQGGEVKIFEIAKQLAGEDTEIHESAEVLNGNLNQLRNVVSVDLPMQSVPFRANLDDAIDIFDRVNSQGTKLTDADLALTHITGKWSQARREMKFKMKELAANNFDLDLTFMTRALTGVVTKRALFEMIHEVEKDRLVTGWKELTKILDYLVTTLPTRAYISSTQDLNSTNTLVPIIVHLSQNGGKFSSERQMNDAIHWLYAAHTWSRYTSQTDQRLESDVSIIVREENPWDDLRKQIIDQRGRLDVKPDDLEGRGVIHPLYRMTYILAKAQGATDWFNGAPLGTTHGSAYKIHNHHIFPSSVLYRDGFDPENHLHVKIVNEIGNRAFLTAESNLALSNKPPAEYLTKVEESYPGALAKQFVPMEPELWKVENYAEFLAARRNLIAVKLNEFMDSLISEPEIVHRRSVAELIPLGESATLEFKSTFQWDLVQGEINKALRQSVLKTICAFLNSAGGTLVIGVEDDGNVIGLDNDLKTLGRSLDKYQVLLGTQIAEFIGPQYSPFLDVRFEDMDGTQVAVVDVERSSEPAFLRAPRGSEFYVRMGSLSRMLDPEQTLEYTQNSWE